VSDETIGRRCDRRGCTSEATKHLTYMEQARVTDETGDAVLLAAPINHMDFCDRHLPEARTQFGGHVQGLAEQCSPECPKR